MIGVILLDKCKTTSDLQKSVSSTVSAYHWDIYEASLVNNTYIAMLIDSMIIVGYMHIRCQLDLIVI